jgi:Protein of unknown function (DUF559)
MPTRAAASSMLARSDLASLVQSRSALYSFGFTEAQVCAQLAAGRWRSVGVAVVLHNAALIRDERWRAAVLNCGPRAVLTSFTALEMFGLTGWQRDEIHVLSCAGAAKPAAGCDLPIVLHRTRIPIDDVAPRRCHRPAPAALIAAASFRHPRPAIGLLAALVQQRLALPGDLRVALALAPRVRHRAAMSSAVADIEMGADALSEIDFVQLCRRAGLPAPVQQSIRIGSDGTRRYLDAEWRLPDGTRLVVEIDGAVHLAAPRWFADQLRQNEITLTGSVVLRFPSVVVRTEPALVIDQLRRALGQRDRHNVPRP